MHGTISYGHILHERGTNCVMKAHINGRQNSPKSMNNLHRRFVGWNASGLFCKHCALHNVTLYIFIFKYPRTLAR